MVRGRDFVIVGLTPYDVEFGSNCKNIAEEIAKHNRVLYINRPVDRASLITRRNNPSMQKRIAINKGEKEDLVQVSENLWNLYPKTVMESVNWLNINSIFDYINKVNNQRLANKILGAIERLGFKDFILFNDNDFFKGYHLKELLQPSQYVYYIRDYLVGLKYWAKHGERMEKKLIGKADVVVTNSTYLSQYAEAYNHKVFYVGQGCDLSHFKERAGVGAPEDLQNIQSPVVGYVGALNSHRLDISILEYIADNMPEWNLVLVGPEDENFQKSSLHKRKNVHFLGNKSIQELPQYIQRFDVCLNPQLVNALTIGNYPRKIDEYLAMGKPSVATKTKAMEVFKDHVYLANSKEEYVQLIRKAYNEFTDDRANMLKAFAATHTWENSVRGIYNAILAVERFEYALAV
ncbi:glycosyltransferase [Cytophagaceae bacterium ABcell3]|nr:glycosyltransferase [Cytophagaceae bacterium ABcell3]